MAVKIGPPASWERKAASPAGRMVICRGCELLAFHHLPEVAALEGTERNEVDVDGSAVEAGRIERVYSVVHLGSNLNITRAAFCVAVR